MYIQNLSGISVHGSHCGIGELVVDQGIFTSSECRRATSDSGERFSSLLCFAQVIAASSLEGTGDGIIL